MDTYILVQDTDAATTAELYATLEEAVRVYFDAMKEYGMDEETKDKMRTLIQETEDSKDKDWGAVHGALTDVWAKMQEEDPHIIDTMYIQETRVPMPKEHQDVAELAREKFESEGDLEFDDTPLVSMGDDNGAYVQCWKWLDFSGTPFDKSNEDETNND